MIDNSTCTPTRLTIPLGPAYPSLCISYPFSSFQVVRILMAFHVFLFLLLFFLILSLARLWRLYLPHYCHPHSSAEMMRTTIQRLLKPRTPLDCPACRLSHTLSSDVGLAPRLVRPWCEVKSRRGAPKRLNTAGFACPNHQCPYFGITDAHIHALVGDGTHGRTERIQTFRGPACHTTFSARRYTPLYRLNPPLPAGGSGANGAGRRAESFRRRACLRLPADHHHEPF